MTQRLGILGYPVRHSISPAFQQAALEFYGIDARYEAWETAPDKLKARIEWMRVEGVLGANLTVPHKEKVAGFLDEVDDLAQHLGSINTVVVRRGRLVGYNTDAYGFLRSLRESGFEVQGRRVLILGAGGSGRTVALTLIKEGVRSLTIANRTVLRAQELVLQVPELAGVETVSLESLSKSGYQRDWELIVNCTSIGMRFGRDEGRSPIGSEIIPAGAMVYDLVYTPRDTPLLKEARKAGAETLDGLPMLIYQGAEAFRLWTSEDPPVSVMFKAAESALCIPSGEADLG